MNRRFGKRMLIMLIATGLLLGGVVGYQIFVSRMMKQFMSANAQPPATVTATHVKRMPWQHRLSAVGTLRAEHGVTISSEVAGIVEKVSFNSGEEAQKGRLLVALETHEEQAQLAALMAARKLAEINHKRNSEQFEVQAISRAEFDASRAELDRSIANVQRQEAAIEKRNIKAPFSGRLGVSTINPGQFINPAEKIVSLQDIRRLYVDFKLPQKNLNDLHQGQRIILASDTGVTRTGQIHAVNNIVDPTTRNLTIEGMVDNTDRRLLPGMFVKVAIDIGKPESLLTLPQTAISYNPYGSTVFIAIQGHSSADLAENKQPPVLKARQVFIQTGARRGDQIAILGGINEDDLVVTSGQMKLKNGTPLIIDNSVSPANEIAPRPQDS